jgi:hypothetical protein
MAEPQDVVTTPWVYWGNTYTVTPAGARIWDGEKWSEVEWTVTEAPEHCQKCGKILSKKCPECGQ